MVTENVKALPFPAIMTGIHPSQTPLNTPSHKVLLRITFKLQPVTIKTEPQNELEEINLPLTP